MKYDTLIEELIDRVPELQKLAEKESHWWGGEDEGEPLVHVFFGDVFNPFLLSELSAMRSQELMGRVFGFLESMALSDDMDVRGVLTATILERLGDDKGILEKARSFMGTITLLLSHEVERSWGRE